MRYVYRLMCRIKEEGITTTLKYLFYVMINHLKTRLGEITIDLKYSKKLLAGNQKTPYKHLGANDTYHTDYSAMPIIFQNVTISPQDVLVDVGCGKGRVINYWLKQGYRNKIYGLELDPQIAAQTTAQFERYKNISIIAGDAISNLPNEGTIFYFYNPFKAEKVTEFEKKISDFSRNGTVRIIYYNPKSIGVFENGKWEIRYINFEADLGIKRWGRLNKYHELAIITSRTDPLEDVYKDIKMANSP